MLLVAAAALLGCSASKPYDAPPSLAGEADRYISTIGGTTAIVERLAEQYSGSAWSAGHYDPNSGMITHDRDGQPTESWQEYRKRARAILMSEVDPEKVRAAMFSSLTNTFNAAELEAMNDLTTDERALLWQCASKKHFMQQPRTAFEMEHDISPIDFTREERRALESFAPPVLSALDKLLVHQHGFHASIWPEYRRALGIAKKQAEEEAQPEN